MTASQLSASTDWWVYLAVTAVVTIAAAARGVWSPCGLSMLSAINPLSEHSRGNRYWLTACWFVAGSVLGGTLLGAVAAIGALAWSVAGGPVVVSATLAVLCCLIAIADDSGRIAAISQRLRLPNHPRQVNEQWLARYRRWVYAAGFGAQIGSGFATYIMTAAVYLTVALGVLSGAPMVGLLAGVLFGLVRGMAVLLSSMVKDPVGLRRLHQRLDLFEPWSLRAVMVIEAAAAIVIGYLAWGFTGFIVVLLLLAVGCYLAFRRPTNSTDLAPACAVKEDVARVSS